jgi:glutamate dehydrogenase/leucine dehydrogenase
MHRKLTNRFSGTITGRGIEYGGSLVRTEATGYGAVYFTRDALENINETMEGKVATVSGSGNVAQFASQKLIQLGAKVLTLSDRGGYIYFKDGLTLELLDEVIHHKTKVRGTLEEFANQKGIDFIKGKRPWEVKCDMAFPCATQNEILLNDAMALVENGCKIVTEGANMPTTKDATEYFVKHNVTFLPAKAANAGGVAVSALEMSQAFVGFYRSFEEVDKMLQQIMNRIHNNCLKYGNEGDKVNYINGANIAGFVKVANAMIAGGLA